MARGPSGCRPAVQASDSRSDRRWANRWFLKVKVRKKAEYTGQEMYALGRLEMEGGREWEAENKRRREEEGGG